MLPQFLEADSPVINIVLMVITDNLTTNQQKFCSFELLDDVPKVPHQPPPLRLLLLSPMTGKENLVSLSSYHPKSRQAAQAQHLSEVSTFNLLYISPF